MRPHSRATALAFALVATSGCSSIVGACPDDLRWRIEPEARTLRVGERVTPRLTILGCAGTKRLDDTITWDTADRAIVHVEPTTGRVTALAPGTATVVGRAARYGVDAPVRLTVVAP